MSFIHPMRLCCCAIPCARALCAITHMIPTICNCVAFAISHYNIHCSTPLRPACIAHARISTMQKLNEIILCLWTLNDWSRPHIRNVIIYMPLCMVMIGHAQLLTKIGRLFFSFPHELNRHEENDLLQFNMTPSIFLLLSRIVWRKKKNWRALDAILTTEMTPNASQSSASTMVSHILIHALAVPIYSLLTSIEFPEWINCHICTYNFKYMYKQLPADGSPHRIALLSGADSYIP